MKLSIYEVYGQMDDEIRQWCKEHEIRFRNNIEKNRIAFIGTDDSLEELHNEFFEEYEFKLK